MTTQKEVMKELYDAAILTAGAMVISFVSRKTTKEPLGIPLTLSGAAKISLAFGLSAVGVKLLQDKGVYYCRTGVYESDRGKYLSFKVLKLGKSEDIDEDCPEY